MKPIEGERQCFDFHFVSINQSINQSTLTNFETLAPKSFQRAGSDGKLLFAGVVT
jgi:hypothetical protein